MDKEKMKTFDNVKDCCEYLDSKAKLGEEVCLDLRPTVSNPRKINYFKKKEKPKVKLYCKNPKCFTHYLANNKIKETKNEGEK